MNFSQTLKISWEGLTLNKVRSFLTTLGVIIGVAAVIVMLAVSAGAEAEIADQINELGANLIMIMPSMSRGGVGGVKALPWPPPYACTDRVMPVCWRPAPTVAMVLARMPVPWWMAVR